MRVVKFKYIGDIEKCKEISIPDDIKKYSKFFYRKLGDGKCEIVSVVPIENLTEEIFIKILDFYNKLPEFTKEKKIQKEGILSYFKKKIPSEELIKYLNITQLFDFPEMYRTLVIYLMNLLLQDPKFKSEFLEDQGTKEDVKKKLKEAEEKLKSLEREKKEWTIKKKGYEQHLGTSNYNSKLKDYNIEKQKYGITDTKNLNTLLSKHEKIKKKYSTQEVTEDRYKHYLDLERGIFNSSKETGCLCDDDNETGCLGGDDDETCLNIDSLLTKHKRLMSKITGNEDSLILEKHNKIMNKVTDKSLVWDNKFIDTESKIWKKHQEIMNKVTDKSFDDTKSKIWEKHQEIMNKITDKSFDDTKSKIWEKHLEIKDKILNNVISNKGCKDEPSGSDEDVKKKYKDKQSSSNDDSDVELDHELEKFETKNYFDKEIKFKDKELSIKTDDNSVSVQVNKNYKLMNIDDLIDQNLESCISNK